jgi:integrase
MALEPSPAEHSRATPTDPLPELHLPRLPPLIRYEDEFTGEQHVCRELDQDVWNLHVNGSATKLDFSVFPMDLRHLLKLIALEGLTTGAPATVLGRHIAFRNVDSRLIRGIILSSPTTIRQQWAVALSTNQPWRTFDAVKSMLRLICRNSILDWSPIWLDLIGTLPLPRVDKWASVRTGDVFLSVSEETEIVRWIDERARRAREEPGTLSTDELIDAGLVVCSYQFGMRPIQIGLLRRRDYREWKSSEDATTSVHLTFRMVKQRTDLSRFPLLRKIKREWAVIFVELFRRGVVAGVTGSAKLFGLASARLTAARLTKILSAIVRQSRSATDLRHTAAQRLVDAGASREELAEFMGHIDVTTGLVYFDTSANQAERVNRALGISETYQRVAKIAHARFITEAELAELKGEQQVAGVPHGIPIGGIGGCSIGQPSCPYNPVTACYGCEKFMPVSDVSVHQQVLADFRSTVSFFNSTSRHESDSPAFLQLQRTIASVQAVIDELEGGRAGE